MLINYRGVRWEEGGGGILTTLSSGGAVCWNHLRNNVRRVVRFGCISLDPPKNVLAIVHRSSGQGLGGREMGEMESGILDFTCKILPHQTEFVL